ncbi:MAG: AMP-binding protein, partial [Methylomonas sp.]
MIYNVMEQVRDSEHVLIPLSDLLTAGSRRQPIAKHDGGYYSHAQFCAAVGGWAGRLVDEPEAAYALYSDDAYPFAVLLFALLRAGKQVWLPGNNRPGAARLLERQGCRLIGDWTREFDYRLDAEAASAPYFSPLNPDRAEIVMFTSGSTGEVKPISKRLWQLQAEIDTLEKKWGQQLDGSQVLATVSHQHIYGLLFRVLWPLAAGRCFHSKTSINPEALLKQAGIACLISSPAYLKRLDQDTEWAAFTDLTAIFSSGGPLSPVAAERIRSRSRLSVIEVYGSTETGGIAWRQQADAAWSLFDGVTLTAGEDAAVLHSPYLPGSTATPLDDNVSLLGEGRFLLYGRRDRIVKIEEKRLSLNDLEQRLTATAWLDDAAALMLEKNRDTVAAAAALSAEGKLLTRTSGRKALIKQLRAALEPWFESVVLPRKWLFLEALPLTAQGKRDTQLLKQLLSADSGKLPVLYGGAITAAAACLQLKVPEDLPYFPDHFSAYPILPGVVQIGWADYFAKLLFAIG